MNKGNNLNRLLLSTVSIIIIIIEAEDRKKIGGRGKCEKSHCSHNWKYLFTLDYETWRNIDNQILSTNKRLAIREIGLVHLKNKLSNNDTGLCITFTKRS